MIKDDRLPLKEKFLEYYRQLPIQKLAAATIGKSEDTITDWKAQDSDFSCQIEDARAQWALDKVKKVPSKEWLLDRILNDHFGPRSKTDITTNGKDLPAPILANVRSNNSDSSAAPAQEES